MKSTSSNVWIGEKDLTNDPSFIAEAQLEFKIEDQQLAEEIIDSKANRRDFLRLLGFSLGAATVAAGCDIPVKRAIPYVVKPDEIVPGIATYYASTLINGGDYCPVLVKTREGRPIKIEGNSLSDITHGGTSARAQAEVLSLYDTNRYRAPQINQDGDYEATSWENAFAQVNEAISSDKVRVISNTILSPSERNAIKAFTDAKGGQDPIIYDRVSSAALIEANEQCFGVRELADYAFDKADVIVSFNADFLGTWISPIEYAKKYIQGRNPESGKMSRHIQVESHMSMTGSNADNRILVKPSEQGAAIAYLCNAIVGGVQVPKLNDKAKKALDKLATELRNATGKSLVVCASNNVSEQILVNAINHTLGNIGTTVSFDHASLQRQGSERAIEDLIADVKAGNVDAVIFNQCNPVYDYAGSADLVEALSNVKKIGLMYAPSETSSICDVVLPVHHVLESWGDAEAKKGSIALIQPTISPLFDTKQAGEIFLTLAESGDLDLTAEQPYMDYLKNAHQANFNGEGGFASFDRYWDSALHDGSITKATESSASSFAGDIASAAANISKPSNSDLEISFYETVNLGNGEYATNPWLMEMPDPVSRTSWGNYLSIPVNFDGFNEFVGLNKLKDGDLVNLRVGNKTMTVPVIQQFGQMPGTLALALGYGRTNSGPCASGVGVNVNDCAVISDGLTQYYNTDVEVSNKVGKEEYFSCVQYHHAIGLKAEDSKTGEIINADEAILAPGYGGIAQGYQGSLTDRSVIFTTHLDDIKKSSEDLVHFREHAEELNSKTLYPYEEYKEKFYSQGHHWGMHVDLNACIGCAACTIACISENNVPVVGKKEVSRHHEMTWLRMDRYYYGDIDSPNVVYQPMMCQHCDNAPCENVCPVNATNHSSEGLNQMAYNRCIGTRYCANNCPYKVRRFNWYDYTTADIFPANQVSLNGEDVPFGADNLTRMVLNPDVTVRTRGVIEKCSFCVQRIQEGKLSAKAESRKLDDADITTACVTACPTGAITFGDMNDKTSKISKRLKSDLNYTALEEINVRPSVTYTMKVNNRDHSLDA